jgi:hypothetical protein
MLDRVNVFKNFSNRSAEDLDAEHQVNLQTQPTGAGAVPEPPEKDAQGKWCLVKLIRCDPKSASVEHVAIAGLTHEQLADLNDAPQLTLRNTRALSLSVEGQHVTASQYPGVMIARVSGANGNYTIDGCVALAEWFGMTGTLTYSLPASLDERVELYKGICSTSREPSTREPPTVASPPKSQDSSECDFDAMLDNLAHAGPTRATRMVMLTESVVHKALPAYITPGTFVATPVTVRYDNLPALDPSAAGAAAPQRVADAETPVRGIAVRNPLLHTTACTQVFHEVTAPTADRKMPTPPAKNHRAEGDEAAADSSVPWVAPKYSGLVGIAFGPVMTNGDAAEISVEVVQMQPTHTHGPMLKRLFHK